GLGSPLMPCSSSSVCPCLPPHPRCCCEFETLYHLQAPACASSLVSSGVRKL
ncbi:hypothetical protein NDU88_006335, partial [Pleurodeles waltl]